MYLPVEDISTVKKRATTLLRQFLPDIVLADGTAPSSAEKEVLLTTPDLKDYAPPNSDDSSYRGIGFDANAGRLLQQSNSVLILTFSSKTPLVRGVYEAGLRVIHRLAVEFKGFPWDEDTRQVFTAEAWKEARMGLGTPTNIPRHITIHLYRDGELLRGVTLGMGKFGLPDVVSENIARSNALSVARLINLTCQTLFERGRIDADSEIALNAKSVENAAVRTAQLADPQEGATHAVTLPVRYVEPDEGDARNRLMRLYYPGKNPQEGQIQAVKSLYGISDELKLVSDEKSKSRALKRLRAEALERLLAIKPRFISDRKTGEELLVKAPFKTTDGSIEWMWVEVVAWEGETIIGVLQSEPKWIPALKQGARVEVKETEIFDYLHKLDGVISGNETAKLLFD